jgi:hypothetical protein
MALFFARLLRGFAGKAEETLARKLTESQKFHEIVHTVNRKGLKEGGKELLKDSAPGTRTFLGLFLDELKRDLGFKTGHRAEQKLLPKSRKKH